MELMRMRRFSLSDIDYKQKRQARQRQETPDPAAEYARAWDRAKDRAAHDPAAEYARAQARVARDPAEAAWRKQKMRMRPTLVVGFFYLNSDLLTYFISTLLYF